MHANFIMWLSTLFSKSCLDHSVYIHIVRYVRVADMGGCGSRDLRGFAGTPWILCGIFFTFCKFLQKKNNFFKMNLVKLLYIYI